MVPQPIAELLPVVPEFLGESFRDLLLCHAKGRVRLSSIHSKQLRSLYRIVLCRAVEKLFSFNSTGEKWFGVGSLLAVALCICGAFGRDARTNTCFEAARGS